MEGIDGDLGRLELSSWAHSRNQYVRPGQLDDENQHDNTRYTIMDALLLVWVIRPYGRTWTHYHWLTYTYPATPHQGIGLSQRTMFCDIPSRQIRIKSNVRQALSQR